MFTEDWYPGPSLRVLVKLARRVARLEGRTIEIGCWEGRSTCALANAVFPAPVDAVDTWRGSPGEISADLAQGRDVLATFVENVTSLTRGNVKIHAQDWREYAEDLTPVRFLHVDAEHTYREVFDAIEHYRPLMVPGGIICGDDAHHIPVMEAVHEQLAPVAINATLWWWECP